MILQGQEVSRRTLIKFIANKTGGAHFDPKDTDTAEAALFSLMDGKMRVASEPAEV
jgi:hypothetical protein